ncbi:hypothetical protein [Burkholderia stagnalis]|uniref:hypothetical protein n=1 Tax=Burkholderia stagnalis TaxID=1503054 RepID=UPI000F5BA98F|nr:hypothetical protein [Burkholderia stagnalis]
MSAAVQFAPVFVPSNIAHAKRKAKQLRRAFPSLTLSSAQQVTAEALGFDDWHALERAVQSGIPASPLDSQNTASELVERHRYQTVVLARRLNIPEGDAGTYLPTWGLTHESRSKVSDRANWPEPPSDENVNALVNQRVSPDTSDLRAVAGQRFACPPQCRLVIVDRHWDSTEIRRRLDIRRIEIERDSRTKRRRLSVFGPHPLESVFSSLDEIDAEITRWDASGAEFLVGFSGAGVLDDVLVPIHRANTLLDKVLPWLLAPFAEHNGDLSPNLSVDSALEPLLRAHVEGLLRGRPEQAIFRPSAWTAGSSVDPKRVQIVSSRLFEYDEAIVGYQHNRWRRHARKSSEGPAAVKQAMLAMDTRMRAAISGDGALGLQYLMPDDDWVELVLPVGSYKVLPPGFHDSAREFVRDNAARLYEFS